MMICTFSGSLYSFGPGIGVGVGEGDGAGDGGWYGSIGSEQAEELLQYMVLPGKDLALFASPSLLCSRSKIPTKPVKNTSPSTIESVAFGIEAIYSLQIYSLAPVK